ncbi:hypothetical protein NR798_06020 [Archangium gephyra]|uniref:O-antigen ligase family protein n=1 Tax=Archangium gephyra TaxID=48 RepID=UPI0035D3E2BE
METKSLIFLALCSVVIPVGVALVGKYPRLKDFCAALMVFGTTEYGLRTINFYSREWYRGTTRGFELCWLDFLWIFILVDERRLARPAGPRPLPFSLGSMLVFFAYNALNAALSEPKLFGLFELSKALRGLMVFLAFAYYVKDERALRRLVWALCIAVIYEWFWTVHARLVLGHARSEGTLSHPNALSMYNLIAVPLLLAVALSDAGPRLRKACGIAAFLGTTSVLFTVSRAGLFSIALLLLAVGLTCGSLRITPAKVLAAALLLVMGAVLYAKLAPSFEARFASEGGLEKEYGGEDNEGRGVYLTLAEMMTDGNVWGCGLNNWSYCVSNQYGPRIGLQYLPYRGTDEVPPDGPIPADANIDAPQAPPGHSLYAITLGETGWPGVLLFLWVWLRWLWMAGSFFSRRSSAFRSRFGVGVFFSLAGAFSQSVVEWEYRQTPLLFLLHILLGALAAVYPARPSVLARR